MNHAQSDSQEQCEPIDVTTGTTGAEEEEADDSDSSDSSSSGDGGGSSSSQTSSDDDETSLPPADATLEMAKIDGVVLPLPRGLCENAAIFREFFSLQTWRLLPAELRAKLQTLLPRFEHLLEPASAVAEQQRTLIMLLGGAGGGTDALHRFECTPLGTLQRQLEEGNCRPDVTRLRQSIAKSRRREQRFQTCERISQLAKQLFVSRERLLHAAYKSAPLADSLTQHYSERTLRRELPSLLYADTRLCAVRARKRYAAEVREMTLALNIPSLSADEADDDDDAALAESEETDLHAAGKNAATCVTTSSTTDKCIYGTLFKRRHDIADEEAVRAAQHAKQPRLSNRNFRQYLLEHKRRKLTEPTLPDFETSDIRLRDVCARAQMGGNFKRIFAAGKPPGRKPKLKPTNEPPALVPIAQPSTAAALLKRNANTEQYLQHQQQQLHSDVAVNEEFQMALDANQTMLQQQAQHQQLQMYLGRQNQTQQHAEEYNRSIAADDTNTDDEVDADENDDNETFNMMDGEVELQQEEVETYGGSVSGACEETLPAFVISNEVVLPQVGAAGGRNQEKQVGLQSSQSIAFAQETHTMAEQHINILSLPKQTTTTKNLIPNYVAQNQTQLQQQQQQQYQQLNMDNLPKLEPLTALNKTQNKEKSYTAITTATSGRPNATASIKTPLNTLPATLAPLKKLSSSTITTPQHHLPIYSASAAHGIAVSASSYIANPELIQETHACFFSLIRDFFCATPNHRMKFDDLKTKIDVWLCNPITALNDWYALAENWSSLLTSAINFLAGDFVEQPDEYVPYIEHKTQLNIYQWIGAGRDTDTRLSALCQYWMQHRRSDAFSNNELKRSSLVSADQATSNINTAALLMRRRRSSSINDLDDDVSSVAAAVASNYDAAGIAQPPPPPPRCPTVWTVRAATIDEIAEFQRQERERFEHPHRAYTYRMHGYESIVGPVKGIYSQILALTKARGHSMMIGDRPNFVTILTLVRDATARLPNGEGTRADISELLKCSQYINRDAAENVLQTIVSGALDRMHTEHDPCVRYDPKRKIWIYLHRNRSEAEFERMHQQYQGLSKHKKPPTATSRKSTPKNTASTMKTVLSKDGGFVDVDSAATLGGVLTDRANAATSLPFVGASSSLAVSASTPTNSFSLPALVPANPIIVSSQQQQQQQKNLSQQSQQTKSLPVPPLKYHNPPNQQQQQQQQQQQKSLLKSTLHHVQRAAASETRRTPEPNEHQNHMMLATASAAANQRNQLRQTVNAGANNTTAANTFIQPAAHVITTATNSPKQYTFSVPQSKITTSGSGGNIMSGINTASSSSSASMGATTPIIVATPSGLQTVHVSNTTSVVSQAQTAAVTGIPTMQTSALSATVGGKKVALNKPIIINQITTQTTLKNKSQQIAKQQQQQQQQQQQSFFIPISSATPNEQVTQTPRHVQTIFMDNTTQQLIQATHQPQSQPQQQTKNIIRLVPAAMNNSLKSISISSSSSSPSASVVTTTSTSSVKQQPVHIIGQRVIANTTVRPQLQQQQQQQKTIGGISFVTSNVAAASSNVAQASNASATGSGGAIVKMSPQAFASLQQKQGQHILLKQAASGQPQQQQRVLVGNTAIIAQSTQGGTNKNLVLQQQQQPLTTQKVITLQHANASSAAATAAASSVGSQTSSVNISSAPVSTVASNKIQTINATNLTPQQQRVLLQNLKQQQQQIQFKTVQVVSNAPPQQQQQLQERVQQSQTQQQQLLRNQAVTIVPQRSSASVQTATAQTAAGKTMSVVVSQPQGLTRLIKTTPQQVHIPQHTSNVAAAGSESSVSSPGTRVLTSSTGQIISLESLLQKQGGALRITGSNSGIKSTQMTSSNLLQLAAASAGNSGGSGQQQYAVVSQGRNIISLGTSPQRFITTQANTSNTTTAAAASTVPRIATSATTTIAGRILSAGGGQQHQLLQGGSVVNLPQQQQQQKQQVTNVTKVFGGKTITTANSVSTATAAGNIRVINAGGTGTTSFNIANIQGKQVVFATKAGTSAASGMNVKTLSAANQAQQLQNSGSGGAIIVGGQTVRLQGNTSNLHLQQQQQQQQIVKGGSGAGGGMALPTSQMQTVIMGNQILRVQQMPQTMKATPQNRIGASATVSSNTASANNEVILNSQHTANLPKTLVLGSSGQTIRLHQPTSSIQTSAVATTTKNVVVGNSTQHSGVVGKSVPPASRVVLAVQGGGQIFLSPNFQGGTLNLKSLQNMKVVSLAQTTKDMQQDKLPSNLITTPKQQQQLSQQSILKNSGGGGGGGVSNLASGNAGLN